MQFKMLLIAAMAASIAANAQQTIPVKKNFLQRQQAYNTTTAAILQRQAINAAPDKGTAVVDRLIGYGGYSQGTMVDTARFWYTGTNGSHLNNLIIQTYFNDGSSGFGQTIAPSFLNSDRNTPPLYYDSSYYRMDFGGGQNLLSNGYRQYGPSSISHIQKIRLNVGAVSFNQRNRDVYGYNAAGNIISVEGTVDTTMAQNGAFLANYLGKFTYANNRAAKDSFVNSYTGISTPYSQVLYSYDANGNLTMALQQQWDGMTYADYSRDVYNYTAANKLSSHAYDEMNTATSVWETNAVDTFRYTGSNMTYNVHYERNTGTGLWEDGQGTDNYYNATGSLDSQYSFDVTSSGNVPINKVKYKYTSYNHYDKLDNYYHNGTVYSTTPDDTYQFYYDTYNTTGVSNTSRARNDISIYPIPAREMLNIRFEGKASGSVTVNILNMAGQLIQRTTLAAGSLQLGISQLAPGNYVAAISDENGSQNILFVK